MECRYEEPRKDANPGLGRATDDSRRDQRLSQFAARHDCRRRTDSIPDARSKISEYKPDLLLTALRLGIGDSLEFIKALKVQAPGLLILMYAAFTESIFAEWALRAGANGYLMKTAAKEELPTAIRAILRGQIYIGRDLGMHPFQESAGTSEQNRVSGNLPVIDNLSARETHVFLLIGSGRDTKKIVPLPVL